MSADEGGQRAGWTGAVLVSVAFTVTMLSTTLPTPLYPALATKFDFGELVTTVVFAVYPVGVTSALLVCGRWSDQLGRKPMLFAGLACSTLSAVVFLLANALSWILVARLLTGFSAGIFTGTATAAIVDILGEARKSKSDVLAASTNMGALGLGPLIAGMLAAWVPRPLATPFVVDLGLLVLAAGCVWAAPETVRRDDQVHLTVQRLQVPREIRPIFVRAAFAGFAGFAVLGLFGSVSPAFLGEVLHETSPALNGLIVFAVFLASVAGQLASTLLDTEAALTSGCIGLVLGMAIFGVSLPIGSLALLITGGLVAGIGQGLSFRAGLGSVTDVSPPEHRGEIASAFFVALYIGIAIPVVGVGLAATAFGLVTAGVLFAVLVGILAGIVLALLFRDVDDESRQAA